MTAPSPRRRRFGAELLIEVPAVILTFVMMIHITVNALLRTFANSPVPNTLEIVQYWYLPIVAFLGFIAAQFRGQHIAADLIFQMLPRVTRKYVLAVVNVVCAATSAAFAWYVWGDAVHAMETGKVAGVSEVVSWPAYFFGPLAFACLTVQFALVTVRAITRCEDDGFIGDLDDVILQEQQ